MKRLMILMPLIAGILWGSVAIFVRKLTAFGMDSWTILFTRVAVASIIMVIFLLIRNRSLLKIRIRDLWLFAGSGIVAMLGLNYCYTEAINALSVSLAAVLLSLSPVFVMIFAAILFHERITRLKIVCTFFAMAGCFLVSGILEAGAMRWSAYGIIIGVMAAVFYALYSIFSKVAMERDYNVFTITFYSMLLMAIVLLPLTDWNMTAAFVSAAPVKNTLFMIVHSLCSNILPYICYTWSLHYVDAGKAAILAAGGEPAAAMIFGIIFFGEIPSVLGILGLIITIIAISILCRPEHDKETPNEI
jgi:drug/metabolite transporter (DMT)-like permease